MTRIFLVGLGPGDPTLLTRAAWDLLQKPLPLYTPTPHHPALAHYEPALLFALPLDTQEAVALLRTAITSHDALVCALPGDPNDHPLSRLLTEFDPSILPGLSLIDAYCRALRIDRSHTGLQILPAEALFESSIVYDADTAQFAPAWSEMLKVGTYTAPLIPFPLLPTRPALVSVRAFERSSVQTFKCSNVQTFERGHHETSGRANEQSFDEMSEQLHDRSNVQTFERLNVPLQQRYPADTEVIPLYIDEQGRVTVRDAVKLGNLDHVVRETPVSALYIPAIPMIADQRGIDGLVWVVARLLGPGGCPWDRVQTHQSLRQALLEEAYEVLEALDADDMVALADEMGDFLLQVLVHSEMARQAGQFEFGDVLSNISSKLIGRHPHVFGDLSVSGTGEVLHNWEQIKARELEAKGRARSSALDGIPPALPALASAQKMIKKAARTGFDWPTIDGAWNKFREELAELEEAYRAPDPSQQAIADELGDVFFTLVNLARWLHLDAETVLRETGHKFRRRFQAIEAMVAAEGRTLTQCSLDEQLALWNRAKKL